MKALHDYLGEYFVASFQLAALNPKDHEATLRFVDNTTMKVDLTVLDNAITESIVSTRRRPASGFARRMREIVAAIREQDVRKAHGVKTAEAYIYLEELEHA